MNEEKVLFKITQEADGVSAEIHCDMMEELVNVAKSIAGVAREDELFCWTLLISLRHAFTKEGDKEYEDHTIKMPDFNNILKNMK